MQSLNKKELKLLELQITQTRNPKSAADGQTDGVDPLLDLLSLIIRSYDLKLLTYLLLLQEQRWLGLTGCGVMC